MVRLACLLVLVAFAAPAHASTLRPDRDALLRVTGLTGDWYGVAATGVGDVNGDGFADVAALNAPAGDASTSADVLVALGGPAPATVTVAAPAPRGALLDHAPDQVPTDVRGLIDARAVGTEITRAGDVNGDGLDDLAVGQAGLGNAFRRGSGSVFVVLGHRDFGPVRLDALGDRGYRVDGARAGAALGSSVAGLGDVDGDGLADLGLGGGGAAYVLFGSRSVANVDLRAPQGRAYALSSPLRDRYEVNAHSVFAAGDANGDGRGDLGVAVGGILDEADAESDRGRVRDEAIWVTFGKADTAPVDLRRVGAHGYAITGTRIDAPDPGTVAPVGDATGDGRADVALSNGSRAWIVPGQAGTRPVDVRTDPGVMTVRYGGAAGVAGVGDVDGDGRGDLALAGSSGSTTCGTGNGTVTVVRGGLTGEVDARELGGSGFRLTAAGTGFDIGGAVAPAGDVDGDGRADLLVPAAPPAPDRFQDQRSGVPRTHDLVVATAAPTAAPAPARCVDLELRTRSVRAALRDRRVRFRLTARLPDARDLTVSLAVRVCRADRCAREAMPGVRSLRTRLRRSRLPASFPLGPAAARLIRDPRARDLVVCVNEEACATLPIRR